MIGRLFRRPGKEAEREPRVPEGKRVYAIGDVHGRLDLLRVLLDRIEADDAARPPAETHIVFLGDLVDRGPESAQVIDHVMARCAGRPTCHFIQGNHEEAFVAILNGARDQLEGWLQYGGLETLDSYGVSRRALGMGGPPLDQELARVPAAHKAFMTGMQDSVRIGDYLFVHAGIRPGVALEKQAPADMRWIREEFLDSRRDHGVIVVHGHTISEEVEERPNRIGIDTGAYHSGRLTALGLNGAERWLLATSRADVAA